MNTQLRLVAGNREAGELHENNSSDVHAHRALLVRVERAYHRSTEQGRDALLTVLLEQFGNGYEAGLEDGTWRTA